MTIKKMIAAVELDHAELTVRLLEIGCGLKRPEGQSGSDAMKQVLKQAEDGTVSAYIVRDFQDMATAAIEYLRDQVNDLKSVN